MTMPKVGSSECIVAVEVPVERMKGLKIAAPSGPASVESIKQLTDLVAENGVASHPFVLPHIVPLLTALGSKNTDVRNAAGDAAKTLFEQLTANPNATEAFMPHLLECCDDKLTWQTRSFACKTIAGLTHTAPGQVGALLPEIIPVVSMCVNDAKPAVADAARETMVEVCKAIKNKDVEPFIPALMSALGRPAEVPDTVHKLSAVVFVEQVTAPTLSIMVPLLIRGLREKQKAIQRKCCVIIDNMSKLVDNPADAAIFLPRLQPGVQTVLDEVADPEVRSVAQRTLATLARIVKESAAVARRAEHPAVLKAYTELAPAGAAVPATVFEYAAHLSLYPIDARDFEFDSWKANVMPYLAPFLKAADADALVKAVIDRCYKEATAKPVDEDDDGTPDLCDCEFSLAYGGKILLKNARLHLKKGRRYGLCGPNGAGKSTLMRAIANGQVDGFPPKDVLRTVYVEHDIDASQADTPALQFVAEDPEIRAVMGAGNEAKVKESLLAVGFTEELIAKAVASLSGGWKMKLALTRAMLLSPHILLLDEPTNHLDVVNVAWLEAYLTGLSEVTCMVVSHDSGFLDNVCTDILHYEALKLKSYRGNLSAFVAVKPEAQSYYELGASTLKFKLPEPGFLEGVNSKEKAILRMNGVSYKYPNTERLIFTNVSLQCSLSSRVACVGPNGAGKSTLIKVLTGEAEPTEGNVWKHPNLRIAYVAQHAFHHLEQHLDKTPNQYIQWRYAPGEDREAAEKETRQVTEEEQKKMEEKFMHNGVKKVVEKILGRRKLKKGYEYEVQWQNMSSADNSWLTRDVLEAAGFGKMVNEVDAHEAARLGLMTRALTAANVQKQLEDLGLESEFATHSQIRGLSGGQKVKVVLAAAMWLNPHLLVLDEPTNYLDRDSLGALAEAIKAYGGGVIIITHHCEFADALCKESWSVNEGVVDIKGQSWMTAVKEKIEFKVQEEVIDAFGNVIKVKAPKKEKLSNKERKALEKARKMRRERGEVVTDSEDEA